MYPCSYVDHVMSTMSTHALAPQPGLEHHHDLVQRPRALVVGRDEEEDPLALAAPRAIARMLEAAAHPEHGVRRPDRGRVLLEAGDLLRVRVGARRDDELVVAEALPVGQRDEARVGIDLCHAAVLEVDAALGERLAQPDQQRSRIGPERHVDAVGAEEEVVVVGDEADGGLIADAHAQQERRLQRGEAASEHQDPRRAGHGSTSVAHVMGRASCTEGAPPSA